MNPQDPLTQALTHYTTLFTTRNPQSRHTITSASALLPSGTTRAGLYHPPHPLVFRSGHSCYLTSLDGDEYLDFVSEYTAGMFGHSHPEVITAIHSVTTQGFTLGGVTEKEGELARLLVSRFPSMDAIRFCNSGTEANMFALGVAGAYTGRKKIMVFKNGYHGGTLSFGPNNALNVPHEFIQGIYNDIEATKPLLTSDIAAILIEPMQAAAGMIPASPTFLQFLRDEATRLNIILIFDEVVTSRLWYGGLQEKYNIVPDMTTIGKHFGGGFSFGAFGGKGAIMEMFNPNSEAVNAAGEKKYCFHSGTWNNNLFSMTAGCVAARLMSREALERANELGEWLRETLQGVWEEKWPGLVVMRGVGSAVGMGFSGEKGEMVRELYYFYLLSEGVYMAYRGSFAVNLVHGREHVQRVAEVTRRFCEEVLVV
ncbi:PLP-dependent transferase [Aspergillus sclerotiicarbonarius CBS 121057]|uniref:PLP-dependent transferase n=1 Tax=Aspergillus sclerotiicarbonarius (strain CBS 121057 / IBT 28362) TaxID=1448318 RepID=A0A319EVJ5_ASPSB|nr:PLP-dependent transferase [Aspergillus sclerotiicarbonarius CBS 121057]